jgi:hypothetical protein
MTEDHMPALDSVGCSAFVSLDSMALLCENDELRFGVERVVEKEREINFRE